MELNQTKMEYPIMEMIDYLKYHECIHFQNNDFRESDLERGIIEILLRVWNGKLHE